METLLNFCISNIIDPRISNEGVEAIIKVAVAITSMKSILCLTRSNRLTHSP